MGRVHGSIFFTILPGKNPISSSTVTTGRVTTSFLISPFFNCEIAFKQANNVLPVPAGPTAIIKFTLSSFK